MAINGYSGKIGLVDLTLGKTENRDVDVEVARKFIGDTGINLRLAYDLIRPGTDPLSPENIIIIGAGPLVGALYPAPRCTILTKMPLTGAITFSSGSMDFSRRLKYAGYDHIIITGRSMKPVYLHIYDGNIEICDAADLWGKDIGQATDMLWDKYGKQHSVIAIGQAGENQVKVSLALVDRIASVGKGGLAAVMGSKNLKAIATNGTQRVHISDPSRLKEVVRIVSEGFVPDPILDDYLDSDVFVKKGKMPYFDRDIRRGGGYLCKNWSDIYPLKLTLDKFGSEVYFSKVTRSSLGCPGCPHPCKEVMVIKDGGSKTAISSIVGRMWDMGIRCGVEPIENVIECIDLINRYGIDSHVFAPLVDYVVELYDHGIINTEDTGGMVLKRDYETTSKLIEQVTYKQGFGEILGNGFKGIIDRFGKEAEKHAVHIKGLPVQVDPRTHGFTMHTFGSIVNPEGAGNKPGHQAEYRVREDFTTDLIVNFCRKTLNLPQETIDKILDVPYGYNVARITKYSEDFWMLLNCLGICDHRARLYSYETLSEIYSAVTGIEVSRTELQETAERVWNIYKAINVKEGFNRKDDKFPSRWLIPVRLPDGKDLTLIGGEGKPISSADIEHLLDDYYEERGWEMERGIPTKGKLISLGLDFVAEDLEKLGIV